MLQSALRLIYPAQCVSCGDLTETDFALCGTCWRDTSFIGGLVCDACGSPLPGEDRGEQVLCDDCMVIARPWARGRAALVYDGTGRKLVLALKHGDRTEIARTVCPWMARAAAPLLRADTALVPIPLHWTRLLQRRYNQAGLLVNRLSLLLDLPCCPDALVRRRRTTPLGGKSREDRFKHLSGTIVPHPRRNAMKGKPVLLVDDVMTSGATLAAATEAAHSAGASEVCALLLARATKAP